MTQAHAPVASSDAKPFDVVGFTMDYEAGELDRDAIVAGFQRLIDSGLAFQIQGDYGRMANSLIEQGLCTPATIQRAVGASKKVGPYESVCKDVVRKVGSESYRIMLYAGYNAAGLISSECNGIAVLSEDRTDIVCDELGREPSGSGGPSQAQLALFETMSTCTKTKFRAIVNASNRLRYSI